MKLGKKFFICCGSVLADIAEYLRFVLILQRCDLTERQREVLEEIESKGFCVIKGYYDKSKCNNLLSSVNDVMGDSSVKKWVDSDKSDHRVLGVNFLNHEFESFLNDSFISDIACYYMKSSLKARFTLAGKLIFVKGNAGSGGGWHRDTSTSRQFKSILYLTDVTEENGAFEYQEGSHKKSHSIHLAINGLNTFRQTRFSNIEVSTIEKQINSRGITLAGKQGDLILVDTRGIHRGAPIRRGLRYALTNYYWPKKIPEHIKEQMVDV